MDDGIRYAIRMALEGSPYSARALEDEIERAHKTHIYCAALMQIVQALTLYNPESDAQYGVIWAMLRATPEQRAQAFLKVMEQQ